MPVSFPCGVCCKPVAVNHRAVQCDICNFWIHIKCNSISPDVYEGMKDLIDFHWCCFNASIPFFETPDEILKLTLQGKNPDYSPVLVSKQDKNLASLLNALESVDFFSNELAEPDCPPSINKCLYYSLSEFNEIKPKSSSLSFFHQNIASLSLHFDELSTILLNSDDELSTILLNSDTNFDFIGISETGFNIPSSHKHSLTGYRHLDCNTESSKGGVRLYFSDRFNYKRRTDLKIYDSKNLESVFVEILSENTQKNLIVGCIYRHPKMDVCDFNKLLHELLEKVALEDKKIVLLGDFNIDLLKLDVHDDSSTYFDIVSSFGLLPTILRPSRITCRSKTLIDNIFSNFGDVDTTSGNLIYSISDHLPQFAIFDFSVDKKKQKQKTFVRNYKKFNRKDFL